MVMQKLGVGEENYLHCTCGVSQFTLGQGVVVTKINAIFSVEAFFDAWELFGCNIRQRLLFFFVGGGSRTRN
jgi:hypothetical protein